MKRAGDKAGWCAGAKWCDRCKIWIPAATHIPEFSLQPMSSLCHHTIIDHIISSFPDHFRLPPPKARSYSNFQTYQSVTESVLTISASGYRSSWLLGYFGSKFRGLPRYRYIMPVAWHVHCDTHDTLWSLTSLKQPSFIRFWQSTPPYESGFSTVLAQQHPLQLSQLSGRQRVKKPVFSFHRTTRWVTASGKSKMICLIGTGVAFPVSRGQSGDDRHDT